MRVIDTNSEILKKEGIDYMSCFTTPFERIHIRMLQTHGLLPATAGSGAQEFLTRTFVF